MLYLRWYELRRHLITFAIWLADLFPNLASWECREEGDSYEFIAWATTVRLFGFKLLMYRDELPSTQRRRFLPIFAVHYHRRSRTNGHRRLAIGILGFWFQFGSFFGDTAPRFWISRRGRRIDFTLTTGYDASATICLHLGDEKPLWAMGEEGHYVIAACRKMWCVTCWESTHFVYLARYLSRRFPRLASYEATDEHYSGHYIAKVKVLGLSRNQFM